MLATEQSSIKTDLQMKVTIDMNRGTIQHEGMNERPLKEMIPLMEPLKRKIKEFIAVTFFVEQLDTGERRIHMNSGKDWFSSDKEGILEYTISAYPDAKRESYTIQMDPVRFSKFDGLNNPVTAHIPGLIYVSNPAPPILVSDMGGRASVVEGENGSDDDSDG